MSKFKVSYLVSSYDSAHFLQRHLYDLFTNQTDQDFEVVVVNSGSPSYEDAVMKEWIAKFPDRIKYIKTKDRETYGQAWLRAWRVAEGKIVCNSNTDDFHAPRFTKAFYERSLKTSTNIAFWYSGLVVLDEQLKPIGGGIKPPFDFEKYSYECWGGPQIAWRNDHAFREQVDWDFMWKRAGEHGSAFDYWLALYFMSFGYVGSSIQEQLTLYVQRENSVENSNKWRNNYETYASISEFFPHNFSNYLKHAKEFADFNNLPPKQEWIERMQGGKKWKTK